MNRSRETLKNIFQLSQVRPERWEYWRHNPIQSGDKLQHSGIPRLVKELCSVGPSKVSRRRNDRLVVAFLPRFKQFLDMVKKSLAMSLVFGFGLLHVSACWSLLALSYFKQTGRLEFEIHQNLR